MQWQFELTDQPINPSFPITAYQYFDNGVKKGPFYFAINDLISALSTEPDYHYDAESERLKEDSTPSLPYGTIRYSANENRTRQRITMEIPQKQWEIRYGEENEHFYTIGFPRMVIQFLVTSLDQVLRVDETRIYGVLNDGQPISNDTPLFHFPYTNVGKANGIVCWGANARLTVTDLVELQRLFGWFVAAPFGEDHGVRTTHGIGHFRKLVEEIENKPFDDEWLIPFNQTFGELFEK